MTPTVRVAKKRAPAPAEYCAGLFSSIFKKFQALPEPKQEILLLGVPARWPERDRVVAALFQDVFFRIWKFHEGNTKVTMKKDLPEETLNLIEAGLDRAIARHENTNILTRWESSRYVREKLSKKMAGDPMDFVLQDTKPEHTWVHVRHDKEGRATPVTIGTETALLKEHLPGFRLSA